MLNFYSQLKKNDKRTALRNAQIALKNGSKSQPYYWAAFQLTGGY
jgi:CHAT domain-containing protein